MCENNDLGLMGQKLREKKFVLPEGFLVCMNEHVRFQMPLRN